MWFVCDYHMGIAKHAKTLKTNDERKEKGNIRSENAVSDLNQNQLRSDVMTQISCFFSKSDPILDLVDPMDL